jgi:hypothetical protein
MLRPIFSFLGFSHCYDCRSTAGDTDCDSRVVRFDHKESDIYQKRVSSKIIVLKVWNLANRSIVLSPEPFEHVPVSDDFYPAQYTRITCTERIMKSLGKRLEGLHIFTCLR